MYEAAVACYESTGKRKFIDVAIKNADLIDAVFGEGKLRDVPGHQEIEIGLVALYRVTGDDRYLRLAKFFLDERGRANGRDVYGPICQDHLPVTEQREAVGHAVRAGYMYASMTDIAALTGDSEYSAAVKVLWDNVVGKKLSLTGGIGARHEGEAFGDDYELPNLTAYNETCAAQALILWNHRMFLLTGEARYIDILERALYNGFLSGVGMDGRSFYYVNPLACDGEYQFNLGTAMSRQPWYQTSCCPTNVVRLLPALSGYMYARRDRDIYVNLYAAGRAQWQCEGIDIQIEQATHYPWDGAITLDLTVSQPTAFALRLRIPAFARGQPLPSELYRYLPAAEDAIRLTVGADETPLQIQDGYALVSRRWEGKTRIVLRLPLPIRRVVANDAVDELRGKVALERGPIVYALESADNDAPVLQLGLDDASNLISEYRPQLLGGLATIRGRARDPGGVEIPFTAIPYYAWGHRGAGSMTVWLNRG